MMLFLIFSVKVQTDLNHSYLFTKKRMQILFKVTFPIVLIYFQDVVTICSFNLRISFSSVFTRISSISF